MGITATSDFRISPTARKQIDELSQNLIGVVARETRDMAKTLVPTDTHALQKSIKANKIGKDWFVSTNTGYGGFVEFGTVKQVANRSYCQRSK